MRPHNDPMNWWLSNPTSPQRKRDGLPEGKWVLVNGVQRFEAHTTPHVTLPKPKRRTTPAEQPRHAAWHPIISAIRFPGRPCCEVCACLLTHAHEPCPGCLAWDERDAVSASWRMVETRYTNSTTRESEVAA